MAGAGKGGMRRVYGRIAQNAGHPPREDEMKAPSLLAPAALAALALGACQARIGNDAGPVGNGSAENKAQEGQVSISAPGFDMKIDIPSGLTRQGRMNDDNGLIYPNSGMSGIHIQGGPEEGRSDGEVELRFTSADAPDMVARWYQDPARAAQFTIETATREGPDYVFAGTSRERGGQFRIRLAPREGGGTAGRLLLADSE
jgi:hypothetical protein